MGNQPFFIVAMVFLFQIAHSNANKVDRTIQVFEISVFAYSTNNNLQYFILKLSRSFLLVKYCVKCKQSGQLNYVFQYLSVMYYYFMSTQFQFELETQLNLWLTYWIVLCYCDFIRHALCFCYALSVCILSFSFKLFI